MDFPSIETIEQVIIRDEPYAMPLFPERKVSEGNVLVMHTLCINLTRGDEINI